MLCTDPFIQTLKDAGYLIIRLPRADVQPMQIFVREGKELESLGELTTVLVAPPGAEPPPIKKDVPAGNISGRRTGELSFGIGLSVLGTVVAAMGGSKLGLDAKYSNAKSVEFEFTDVFSDSIEVARLDQYLATSDVNPHSRHVAALLESDDIYVTTSIIKSRKINVESKKDSSTGLDLSVPEIQQLVGANVQLSAAATSSSKITYEGGTPLSFGFQAVRLFYDKGRYTAFDPLKAGAAAMRGPGPDGRKYEILQQDSAFTRLSLRG